METPTRNHFTCLWCSEQFKRRRPIGRKPHYCSASCRQRAYEARRRQLHRAGFPQPAPPTSTGFPGADLHPRHVPGYGMARRGRIAHAQRPESFPDGRGFLATLCGAWASPTTRTWAQFLATPSEMARPCKTCSRIAAAFPSPTPVDPIRRLAALSSLVARLRDLVSLPGALPDEVAALLAFCPETPLPNRARAA